jgi:hypothetical protein
MMNVSGLGAIREASFNLLKMGNLWNCSLCNSYVKKTRRSTVSNIIILMMLWKWFVVSNGNREEILFTTCRC